MARTILTRSTSGSTGCAGRAVGVVFFAVFLLAGIGFTIVIASSTWDAWRVRGWTRVPCEVLSASIESDGNGRYEFVATYRYDIEGQLHTSQSVQKNYDGSDDYSDAYRLMARYAPEELLIGEPQVELDVTPRPAECLVDPENPADAVLQPGGAGMAPFIIIPLIFVVVGIAGVWGALRMGDPSRQPLSRSATRGTHPWALRLFFSIFFVAGLVATLFMGRVAWRALTSGNWIATDCRVISSQVVSRRSDDSTTYRPDIVFQYVVDGRIYRSNDYNFNRSSSSGRGGKQRIVNQYPVGKTTTCYVNPNDPFDAVLDRSLGWGWLFALIPATFMAIGLGGMIYAPRWSGSTTGSTRTGARAVSPTGTPGRRSGATIDLGVVSMKKRVGLHGMTFDSAASRRTRFIGTLVVAVFWNGIVAILFFALLREGDVCVGLILSVFGLVGLAILGGAIRAGLALFNPHLNVRMASDVVHLGQTISFEWTWSGNHSRIEQFSVWLEGKESATYRRGTDTHTDTETFCKQVAVQETRMHQPRQGRGTLTIPADTMHSFAAPNNRIVWSLVFHGQIARWPDVKEQIELDVQPLPIEEGPR